MRADGAHRRQIVRPVHRDRAHAAQPVSVGCVERGLRHGLRSAALAAWAGVRHGSSLSPPRCAAAVLSTACQLAARRAPPP
eukprot:363516-Chlamydomonas_euryale.AAC.16